jgi:hypothetical protein
VLRGTHHRVNSVLVDAGQLDHCSKANVGGLGVDRYSLSRGGVRLALCLWLYRAANQGGYEQQGGTKALGFLRGLVNTPGLSKAVRPERESKVYLKANPIWLSAKLDVF